MRKYLSYCILVKLGDLCFGGTHGYSKYKDNIQKVNPSSNLSIYIKEVVNSLLNTMWQWTPPYNEELARTFEVILLIQKEIQSKLLWDNGTGYQIMCLIWKQLGYCWEKCSEIKKRSQVRNKIEQINSSKTSKGIVLKTLCYFERLLSYYAYDCCPPWRLYWF